MKQSNFISNSKAQYTPPTPTRRNCRVSSRLRRRCVHEFATSSRLCLCLFLCLDYTWILIDTDNFFNSDDIITSLFKKLSIFIKIRVIIRYGVCLVSFKIVDRIRRQSSRIVFTPSTPTRQNSFVARLDSFVSSASAVCIGLNVKTTTIGNNNGG